MSRREEIKYPDFDSIVKQCKIQMQDKFEKYGNSWLKIDNGQFWKNRLIIEVNEVFRADMLTDRIRELHDVVNVCSMMIDRYKKQLDDIARASEIHKAEQK